MAVAPPPPHERVLGARDASGSAPFSPESEPMRVALATLRRHTSTIRIVRGVAMEGERPPEIGVPRVFQDTEDAERYLAFWLGDEASFGLLRRALAESAGDSTTLWRWSDHEVARALATQLLSRSLLLMEDTPPYRPWGERFVPEAEEPLDEEVIRPAAAPPPPAPAPPSVLPLLEKVQIEGAYVLPEVLQTLEQIDLTLGTLELAGLSLEPTPTGVPRIESEMHKASAAATDTIDAL